MLYDKGIYNNVEITINLFQNGGGPFVVTQSFAR